VTPEEVQASLFFAACGLVLLLVGPYTSRSERARIIARRLYSQEGTLHVVRNLVTVAPVAGIAAITIAVSLVPPRHIGVWLLLPAVLLASAAFLLSYQVPPVLAPHWMRREIDDGRLVAIRPGRIDWLLFWTVLPVIVLSPIALVLLIAVFGAAQA
jgi:hypothetical protein